MCLCCGFEYVLFGWLCYECAKEDDERRRAATQIQMRPVSLLPSGTGTTPKHDAPDSISANANRAGESCA